MKYTVFRIFVLITCLPCLIVSHTLAQIVESETPRFQLEEAFPPHSVTTSFEATMNSIEIWQETGTYVPCGPTENSENCKYLSYKQWLDLDRPSPGWGLAFLPPFNIYSSKSDRRQKYIIEQDTSVTFRLIDGWAPYEYVNGATDSLESWTRQSINQETGTCQNGSCTKIVKSFADENTWAIIEQSWPSNIIMTSTYKWDQSIPMFSACKVDEYDLPINIPKDCQQVALHFNEKWWFRINRGFFFDGISDPKMLGGTSGPDLLIEFENFHEDIYTNIMSEIEGVLREPPLEFQTTLNSNFVDGRTIARVSPFLPRPPTWRERGKVTLYSEKDRNEIQFNLEIWMYVNSLATLNNQDWHLPSEFQRSTYSKKILEHVRSKVSNVCEKSVWLDSSTLFCSK